MPLAVIQGMTLATKRNSPAQSFVSESRTMLAGARLVQSQGARVRCCCRSFRFRIRIRAAAQARGWATAIYAGVHDGGLERNSAAYVFEVAITLTEAGLAAAPGALSCLQPPHLHLGV